MEEYFFGPWRFLFAKNNKMSVLIFISNKGF